MADKKIGWFDYIKMLFKGKKVVSELVKQYKLAKDVHSRSSWKSVEFWATVLASLGAITTQAAGIIPPPLGLQIAAASSALYALSRGLAKYHDPMGGVKPGISSTETWANALATIAAIVSAYQGTVSPEVAAILAAISAGAMTISRGLAKSGKQPS